MTQHQLLTAPFNLDLRGAAVCVHRVSAVTVALFKAHAVCNGAYADMSALCRLVQRGLLSGRPAFRLFPGQQDVCGVAPTVRTASSSR